MQSPISDLDNHKPLVQQTWLVAFLNEKGFERHSETTFSNGNATLTFERDRFTAHPKDSNRVWSTNLEDADPATIKLLLQQILRMRPFLSDSEIEKDRLETERGRQALIGIANTICQGPDTHSGVQLRRFLWSLYNGHHLVNLWRMISVLDAQRSAWVCEVFAGAVRGLLQEDDIKAALTNSGEMRRWDETRPSGEQLDSISEAERAIHSVLRTLAPCRSHVEFKHAYDALSEAQNAIHRAKAPADGER